MSVVHLSYEIFSALDRGFFKPQRLLVLPLYSSQSLDLHHEVHFLLLFPVLLLQLLVLLKLLVSNRGHLGREHHLVHQLDVVDLLVEQVLGSRKLAHHALSLLKRILVFIFFIGLSHLVEFGHALLSLVGQVHPRLLL